MEPQELREQAEDAREKGQKEIGLTMAIVAVLLAIATLMSHRAHTKEVVLQTKANDQWGYYQARKIRATTYETGSILARLLPDGKDQAEALAKQSDKQTKDAETLLHDAEKLDQDTELIERRANYDDGAELFLEVSIVLCSVALLAESKLFWKLSFISTIAGAVSAAWGLLLR